MKKKKKGTRQRTKRKNNENIDFSHGELTHKEEENENKKHLSKLPFIRTEECSNQVLDQNNA